jgi:hypothetical protein
MQLHHVIDLKLSGKPDMYLCISERVSWHGPNRGYSESATKLGQGTTLKPTTFTKVTKGLVRGALATVHRISWIAERDSANLS